MRMQILDLRQPSRLASRPSSRPRHLRHSRCGPLFQSSLQLSPDLPWIQSLILVLQQPRRRYHHRNLAGQRHLQSPQLPIAPEKTPRKKIQRDKVDLRRGGKGPSMVYPRTRLAGVKRGGAPRSKLRAPPPLGRFQRALQLSARENPLQMSGRALHAANTTGFSDRDSPG